MKPFSSSLVFSFIGALLAILFALTAADSRTDLLSSENYKNTRESCVAALPPQANIDVAWLKSVKTWYALYMNQRDMLRVLSVMYTETADDKCLRLSPCIHATVGNIENDEVNLVAHMCNNATGGTKVLGDPSKPRQWNFVGVDGKAWEATAVIAKTDSKSYKLIQKCWEDGTSGYIVLSALPVLPAITRSEIKTYLDTAGFCPFQRVVAFQPSSCKAYIDQ